MRATAYLPLRLFNTSKGSKTSPRRVSSHLVVIPRLLILVVTPPMTAGTTPNSRLLFSYLAKHETVAVIMALGVFRLRLSPSLTSFTYMSKAKLIVGGDAHREDRKELRSRPRVPATRASTNLSLFVLVHVTLTVLFEPTCPVVTPQTGSTAGSWLGISILAGSVAEKAPPGSEKRKRHGKRRQGSAEFRE